MSINDFHIVQRPKYVEVEPVSLFNTISSGVTRLINTAFPSAANPSLATHEKEIHAFETRLKDLKEGKEAIYPLISCLETQGEKLTSTAIEQIFNLFSNIYKNISFDISLMRNYHNIDRTRIEDAFDRLQKQAETTRFIFLPFLIGRDGGHIVMIGIDQEENELFYYDSMGGPHPETLFPCKLDFDEFIVQIAKTFKINLDETEVKLITRSQQGDYYSCGVCVTLTALQLLEGTNLDTILESPWGNQEVENDRLAFSQALRSSLDSSIEVLSDSVFEDGHEVGGSHLIETIGDELFDIDISDKDEINKKLPTNSEKKSPLIVRFFLAIFEFFKNLFK